MSTQIVTTQEKYTTQVAPQLQKDLGLDNVMMVPRIEKIVVNAGIGRILKDKEAVSGLEDALTTIVGQKPVRTTAKKSIAGFNIREGQDIGMKVTLRGARMWDFLDRIINGALPRIRDFQGIKTTAVDTAGNLTIGIKEHTVFPEIVAEEARHLFPFQITVVSTAQSKEEGLALFRALGLPLKAND